MTKAKQNDSANSDAYLPDPGIIPEGMEDFAAQVVAEAQAHPAPTVEERRLAAQADKIADKALSAINEGTTPKPDDQDAETVRLPKLWSLSEMAESRAIQWLAHNRIPRGNITVNVGDEGVGKSLYWVLLVAYITTGRPFPELGIAGGEPGHVVLFLAENGLADMDRPRMEAAGVNPDYVHIYCVDPDGSGTPPLDAFAVNDILHADFTPSLIVADPWLDMVPSNLSVKDGQQAKRALRPWRELAVKTNAGVLLVCHTNRTDSANARDKYGATAELRKTARMTLFSQVDEETGHLTVGPEKTNITSRGIPASQFRIITKPRAGFPDGVPVLDYVGESSKTATDIIAEKWEANRPDADDRTDVQIWLETYLTDHGPTLRKDVLKAAKGEGFTVAKTLKRALDAIGGVTDNTPTVPRQTVWKLAPPSEDSGDTGPVADPISLEGVPTVSTGNDQGKRNVPTVQSGQSGHARNIGSRQGDVSRLTVVPDAGDQASEALDETILDCLDTEYGLSPETIVGSVPGLTRDAASIRLQALADAGRVTIDTRGRYTRKATA